jgi:hypothetical protein
MAKATKTEGKLAWSHGWERKPPPERKPAVVIDGEWLVIKTEWHRKRHDEYAFALNRIDTPMKLLHWVAHLRVKLWCDGALVEELIYKVCDYHGWKVKGIA